MRYSSFFSSNLTMNNSTEKSTIFFKAFGFFLKYGYMHLQKGQCCYHFSILNSLLAKHFLTYNPSPKHHTTYPLFTFQPVWRSPNFVTSGWPMEVSSAFVTEKVVKNQKAWRYVSVILLLVLEPGFFCYPTLPRFHDAEKRWIFCNFFFWYWTQISKIKIPIFPLSLPHRTCPGS